MAEKIASIIALIAYLCIVGLSASEAIQQDVHHPLISSLVILALGIPSSVVAAIAVYKFVEGIKHDQNF